MVSFYLFPLQNNQRNVHNAFVFVVVVASLFITRIAFRYLTCQLPANPSHFRGTKWSHIYPLRLCKCAPSPDGWLVSVRLYSVRSVLSTQTHCSSPCSWSDLMTRVRSYIFVFPDKLLLLCFVVSPSPLLG